MTTKLTPEQQIFENFTFALGDKVRHAVTGEAGVIVCRYCVQSQTGNTGHAYEVSTGNRYVRRFEIELVKDIEKN